MKIVTRNIADLIHAEYNPRQLTKDQYKEIKDSLTRFGFVVPLLINKHKDRMDIIIGGHQRTKVWSDMGHSTVPTVEENLTLDREKELNVRLNKNVGQWDWELLANNFDDKDLVDWGFTVKELQIRKKKKTEEDDFNPNTAVRNKANSKIGDIYQINDHRLICGDSTDPTVWAELMGDHAADMVFTDPPYNVDYKGAGKKTSNTILNDNMSEEEFRNMLLKSFAGMVNYSKKGAAHYICHSSSSQRSFEDAMEAAELRVKNQIIWNKTVASMGWGDYRWKHEPIFYAVHKDQSTTFYGDRSQYTVWDESWDVITAEKKLKAMSKKMEAGNSTVWKLGRDQNYDHPTQKPLQLIEYALNNSSKEGDLVIDPFGGSGSTLIACDQMGRTANLIDLDPKYIDVMIRRYVKYVKDNGFEFTILKNGEDISQKKWIHGK